MHVFGREAEWVVVSLLKRPDIIILNAVRDWSNSRDL